jgi:hypothetical protein
LLRLIRYGQEFRLQAAFAVYTWLRILFGGRGTKVLWLLPLMTLTISSLERK